jgi:uncharacterized protein (TIGR00369 family)
MKQPNSRHCFVCGVDNPNGLQLEFYATGPGEVTAECTVPDHFQGYPGVVHGGVVAAMLDETCGRAHMTGPSDQTRFMFTARLDIRYRKNVPIGQPLRLVGHAGKSKRRAAKATGEIYGPRGQLLAEAKAVLVNVDEAALTEIDLESLGWKVYDDAREQPIEGGDDS